MHDSQGCGYWYLNLDPNGSAPVLCSFNGYQPDEREPHQFSPEVFLAEVQWAAPDFESFLYRFWVENLALIEFDLEQKPWKQTSSAVRAYVDHYRTSDPPRLEVWPSPLPPRS